MPIVKGFGRVGPNEIAVLCALHRQGDLMTLAQVHDAILAFNRKEGWVMTRGCLAALESRGFVGKVGALWQITRDGRKIATLYSTAEGGMLRSHRRLPVARKIQTVQRMVDGVMRTVKVFPRGAGEMSSNTTLNAQQKERIRKRADPRK